MKFFLINFFGSHRSTHFGVDEMALAISCIPGEKSKFKADDDPKLFFVKFNKKDIPKFAELAAYCHANDLKSDIVQNMVERMVVEKKDAYLSQWFEIADAYEEFSDHKTSISVFSNYHRLDDEMRNTLISELASAGYPLKSEPKEIEAKTPSGKKVTEAKEKLLEKMKKPSSVIEIDDLGSDPETTRLLSQILVELRHMNETFRRMSR